MNRFAFSRFPHCRWAGLSVLLGLASLSGAACGDKAQGALPKAPPLAEAGSVKKVRLVRVEKIRIPDSVTTSGTLAAQDTVVVSAKVPGRLAAIHVDLGSAVKKGEVIAQLEQADYRLKVAEVSAAMGQARALLGLSPTGGESKVDVEETTTVKQAHATLEEARKNLERSRTLLERKLIGRADFDAVEANFARAESAMGNAREQVYNRQAVLKQREAELAIARQALSDSSIVSPLDGVVQTRHRSAGELLAAGTPIATIVSIDPLRLRLDLPEYAAPRVRVGQTVMLLGVTETQPQGRLARVAPAIDEQSRTLTVEAEIPNRGELKPGSFVRAEVVLGQDEDVLAIPSQAIVVFAGIEKVITIKDGKAHEVVITTGRRSGDKTEVKSGIAAGESIVLTPGSLQTGDAVEVETEGPSHAEAG